jgi:hypothetical protein
MGQKWNDLMRQLKRNKDGRCPDPNCDFDCEQAPPLKAITKGKVPKHDPTVPTDEQVIAAKPAPVPKAKRKIRKRK